MFPHMFYSLVCDSFCVFNREFGVETASHSLSSETCFDHNCIRLYMKLKPSAAKQQRFRWISFNISNQSFLTVQRGQIGKLAGTDELHHGLCEMKRDLCDVLCLETSALSVWSRYFIVPRASSILHKFFVYFGRSSMMILDRKKNILKKYWLNNDSNGRAGIEYRKMNMFVFV